MTEYLTTKELADLLRIKERKVYDLAASGEVPCSKAMGKLLFRRDAIEAWIAASSSGPDLATRQPLPNVFLGSHDPLLDWALRESRCGLATYFDGSGDGLARFQAREGIASGLHLFDAETGQWNVPMVAGPCRTMPAVLIQWARRQRGLIFAPGHKNPPSALADLTRYRLVPRQPEAGAQQVLLALLAREDLDADQIEMSEPARTESDAALAVREGKADVAFGLASLAAQYGLEFLPVIEERYDLLVDRRAWFEPAMQRLLAFCQSGPFTARAGELAGYDVSSRGQVHWIGG